MKIRRFEKSDIDACLFIYKYYVDNTVITFEEQTPTVKDFELRLNRIASKYPFIVAEENSQVVGYAYLDTFNERSAYRHTADFSIYLDKEFCHRGFGSLLYDELERQAKQLDIKTLISIITSQNENSVRFHEKLGFLYIGELKNVGYKFSQWLSVKYYQKNLSI